MIRLKAYHTERIEVELEESNVVKSVIDIIRKNHNLTNVDGINEKGRMYEIAEYATSHSWTTEEDRGEPTEIQKSALEAIKLLKALVPGSYIR